MKNDVSKAKKRCNEKDNCKVLFEHLESLVQNFSAAKGRINEIQAGKRKTDPKLKN